MSTEQEKKIQYLMDQMVQRASKREAAEAILAIPGVDVTLPPEPQWEPGQIVKLTITHAPNRVIAERDPDNNGWLVPGEIILYGDDEVTDVEPVAVLTAEDARELGEGRVGIGSFERFFRERGLDL